MHDRSQPDQPDHGVPYTPPPTQDPPQTHGGPPQAHGGPYPPPSPGHGPGPGPGWSAPPHGWTAPPLPPPPRRSRRITIGLAVLVVILAIVVPVAVWAARSSGPKEFTITGTIDVHDSVKSSARLGFACEGSGGFSNIGPASPVLVKDETGTVIAVGEMTGSRSISSKLCELSFTADDVPAGRNYYLVEIARRGELTYTEEEAREPLSLSIG